MSNSKNASNPTSRGQQKQAKAVPATSSKRFNYSWWMQTLGAVLGYKPSLTDRAFTVALDIADLVRDAITEFYEKIYALFDDVKDNVARAARTIANMIIAFAKKFKNSFNQMCTFLSQVCGVSGDVETKESFDALSKQAAHKRKNPRRGSSTFTAQGGDDDDDEYSDFFIVQLITRAVAGITSFLNVLPTLDKSLTRLNAAFTLFNSMDRFGFTSSGKWLVNVISKWMTGAPFFEEVEKNSEFTLLAKTIGDDLDTLETLRNPNLSTLIELRAKEKRLQTLYQFLILATPTKANQFTTIFNAIQKRTAKYAGNVQGMQGRTKPVVLCMSGKAGVGKTTVQRRLEKDVMNYITALLKDATGEDVAVFAEHATRPTSFSRNCVEMTPEYDDGYCNPMFFVLEEFQTMKSAEVNTQWAAKMLRYSDSGPLLLNFAFGEKGTRYFDSPFIIATGNYADHHVPFKDAHAYYRRIEFDLTVVSHAKKGEIFDVVKHTSFQFTKTCRDVYASGYVSNAVKTFNELFPKKAIHMAFPFSYSQLVVLMSLAYLERINPNNAGPDATDTFNDVISNFAPAQYKRVLDVSRRMSATFMSSNETESHKTGRKIPPPSPPPVRISSAESDSDSESSSNGKGKEIEEPRHSDYEESEDEVYFSESYRTNDGLRRPGRQEKLPGLAAAFVKFLNEFTLIPAFAYAEKLHSMLSRFVSSLTTIFTFPMSQTDRYYGRSENVYSLYARLFRSYIGMKHKYGKITSATRKDVGAITQSIRWLVSESRSIQKCCVLMTQKQLFYENSSVGSLLVREAYIGGMTSVQREAIRAQVDYHVAPSVALEKKNVERMRKAIAWRRTRVKRNEKRRAAQFARKDAARAAMIAQMRDRGGNGDGRGRGRIIVDDDYDRSYDYDDDDDWSDLLELQNIHYDSTPVSTYAETDGYARIESGKRKFTSQVFHPLEQSQVDTPIIGEKLRAYIGRFEWKGNWWSPTTPTHDHVISAMVREMNCKDDCKIFVAYWMVHRTARVISPSHFDAIQRLIDRKEEEECFEFCHTISKTLDPYEFIVVLINFMDIPLSKKKVYKRSADLAALLKKIVESQFATDLPLIQEIRKDLSDVGMPYADFGPFLILANNMLLQRKQVSDFANYLTVLTMDVFEAEDDNCVLDLATLVILGVMITSAIALVCYCCGTTNHVEEVSDMMSNLDSSQLDEVQEALDHFRAQSMDNKKPMAKPAKRANVRARFENKFVKQSGHASGIRDLVMQNTYACVDGPNSNLYGSLIMLGGTLGVMNRHVYQAISQFTLLPYTPSLNNNQILDFPKSVVNIIQEFKDADTILLSFPSTLRQHAALYKHLLSRSEYKRVHMTEAAVLSYDELENLEGQVHPISDLQVRKDETFPIYTYRGTKDFDIKQRMSYTWRGCRPGACASPIVAVVNGTAKLVAMHAAGNGSAYGIGVPLFKEDLACFFDKNLSVAQGYYPMQGETICFENTDPILESYEITNDRITTSRNTSPTNVTTFVKTPFQTYQFRGGAPGRPADLGRQAYLNHLEKEEKTKGVFTVPPCVYEYANEFKDEICDLFTSTEKSEMKGCRTLTNEEAIYGFDNIEPIDYTTSDGILCKLMNVKKRDLSDPDHPSVKKVCDYLDESERLKCEDGHFCYQLNTDSLKDEIRDHERVNLKKTRVFNVTDSLNNLEIKKAVGHMVSKMKRTLMLGPAMCGVNPTCSLWSVIYGDFEGGNVVFTDVSGFDFSAVKWLFIILSHWLHLCYGHNRFAFDYAMWAFLSCLQGIRFAYGHGRIINRGNTSGNWITTVMNTMVNTIYHAIAVIHLAKQNGVDPKLALKQFVLVLYSDDNISRLDYPWWNTKNVVKTFKELFNVTLTSVDKGDLSNVGDEIYTIDDAEFLCRKFVKRDGIVYAPLSIDSLLTQLYWVRMPKNAPEGHLYQQLQQNIGNVMRELCEYPPNEAIAIVAEIQKFVSEHELPVTVIPFEYRRGADLKMEYY